MNLVFSHFVNKEILTKSICLFLLIFMFSCSSSTESDNFSIRGVLFVQDEPLSNANVQIDENLNWKTTTDEFGEFEVQGVTDGEHILRASKVEDNDQIVSIESSVNINQSTTDLGEIRLPLPPFMYDIDSVNTTHEKVPLRWSLANDPEFREYKVYRRDNPGLDEDTGELIFVSTSREDTTFIDTPSSSGITYYYRVYVLSAFGKLGGSNLVNIKVPSKNLIQNPGLEESSDGIRPDIWKDGTMTTNEGNITDIFLDSENKINGEYGGKLIFNPAFLPPDHIDIKITQLISKNEFEIGEEYEFSIWIKTGDLKLWLYIIEGYPYSNYWLQPLGNTPIEKNTDWTKYSKTFFADENNLHVDPEVTFFFDDINQTELAYAWIDEVSIKKISK